MPSFAWVSFEHLSGGVTFSKAKHIRISLFFISLLLFCVSPEICLRKRQNCDECATRKKVAQNFSFARLLQSCLVLHLQQRTGLCRAYVNIWNFLFVSNRSDLFTNGTAHKSTECCVVFYFSLNFSRRFLAPIHLLTNYLIMVKRLRKTEWLRARLFNQTKL